MKTKAGIICLAVLPFWALNAHAAAVEVDLGTAAAYAVLAGSTVTNTNTPTVLNGDLGLSPGSSVTGFPPGIVNGTTNVDNAAAVTAQNDLTTAYNQAAGETPATTVPTELGGTILTPGIYNSAAGTFGITGEVTLNGEGDPNAVFIFQMASTLITAGASSVDLINGANAANVFWQVGSSATLGTTTMFAGSILALTSITLDTGATIVCGRALARNGAVTLDDNTVSIPGSTACAAATVPEPGTAAPGTATLLGMGVLLSLILYRRQSRKQPR